MEPITTSILAAILWENLGQPILDSAKDKYGDKMLSGFRQILPFKENENEIIEAEIIEAASTNVITDENSLLKLLEKSNSFQQALIELKKTKSTTEIINSFKNIKNSDIKIIGNNKKVINSFSGISGSTIDI